MDIVLRTAVITLEAATEAAEAFGPLKAILGIIYTRYEVCSQLLPQISS